MTFTRFPFAAALFTFPAAALAQSFEITWSTIDSGGASSVAAGAYTLGGTIGQPDAGLLIAAQLECLGGFWGAATPPACYANCDGSTVAPILNANDFQCFLNNYAAGAAAANCDGSTVSPILNANDFQCFLNKFAAGCS